MWLQVTRINVVENWNGTNNFIIFEQVLGPTHPYTRMTRYNLAQLKAQQEEEA